MSDYAREFLFLLSELRRYEQCLPGACSDAMAYALVYRIRERAAHLIQSAAL